MKDKNVWHGLKYGKEMKPSELTFEEWHRKMIAYLRRCNGGKGFVTDGTDMEGRIKSLKYLESLKDKVISREQHEKDIKSLQETSANIIDENHKEYHTKLSVLKERPTKEENQKLKQKLKENQQISDRISTLIKERDEAKEKLRFTIGVYQKEIKKLKTAERSKERK